MNIYSKKPWSSLIQYIDAEPDTRYVLSAKIKLENMPANELSEKIQVMVDVSLIEGTASSVEPTFDAFLNIYIILQWFHGLEKFSRNYVVFYKDIMYMDCDDTLWSIETAGSTERIKVAILPYATPQQGWLNISSAFKTPNEGEFMWGLMSTCADNHSKIRDKIEFVCTDLVP